MAKLSPDAVLALVRETPLLKPLLEPVLRALVESCKRLSMAPGEALCREGEEGHAMFVVLSGHLVISRSGKQVAVGSPGDCFGEMALIESRERAATLRSLDETEVLEIPELRDELGTSRKYLIPLLEHVDAMGLTRLRAGERRLLRSSDIFAELAESN